MESKFSFKGLTQDKNANFSEACKSNMEYTKKQEALNNLIAQSQLSENKQEKIDNLQIMINDNNALVKEATPFQIMKIYTTFRDLGAFENMIKLYETTNNEEFKNSLMVNEFALVAYNKQKEPNPDKTIEIAQNLIRNKRVSGEICGALGKAYLMKANKEENLEEKRNLMVKSARAYEIGFEQFAEYYPGINAVYGNIRLGNYDKAQKLANLVYYSCMKEGANETNDYWCKTSQLESACIAGKSKEEILSCLDEILKLNAPDWQLQSTFDTLEPINKIFHSENLQLAVDTLAKKINNEPIGELVNKEQSQIDLDNKENAIKKGSFNYRGITSSFGGANSVGGNFRFGGQLPDHTVSRKDIQLFDVMLCAPLKDLFPNGDLPENINPNISLNEITNTQEFLQISDKFIRYHFGTENFAKTGLKLEENAEINNSMYDKAVNNVIALSGKKGEKLADSRTNISAIFALGMGDCRHHAQVKQLMFDRWQSQKMVQALHESYDAINHNDGEAYYAGIEKFKQVYATELRTVDVEINLPIEVESLYNANKTDDGKYIKNKEGKLSKLEEHTMNILIEHDKNDEMEKLKIVDSFYQNNYEWANHDVNMDQIEIKDGKYSINAGELNAERIDAGTSLPINITPACYAGKRDSNNKDDYGDCVQLLGMPFKIQTPQQFLAILQNRESVEKVLNNIQGNINLTKETERCYLEG